MNVDDWLQTAIRDAEARGLPELRPLLEALARATAALRAAYFIEPPGERPGDSNKPRAASQ